MIRKSSDMNHNEVTYLMSPPTGNDDLNTLFTAAWPGHAWRDFQPILRHSLAYLCCRAEGRLIGFINLAWDGGIHAFLVDTTVHPEWRRRKLGTQLVRRATTEARNRGITWLHVDYEPHLEKFYAACGFRPTRAGLIQVRR